MPPVGNVFAFGGLNPGRLYQMLWLDSQADTMERQVFMVQEII